MCSSLPEDVWNSDMVHKSAYPIRLGFFNSQNIKKILVCVAGPHQESCKDLPWENGQIH